MRVALRFIVFVVLAMVAITTLNAMSRIDRDTRALHSDTVHDHEIIGRTLRASYLDLRASDGPERADAMIRLADSGDPRVTVRLLRVDGLAPDLAAAMRRGAEVTRFDGGFAATWIPLPESRAIEIRESLARIDAFTRETIARNVRVTIILVLVFSLMAAAFGTLGIGRPLARLAAQARRIGEGDLSYVVDASRRDEIGDLTREMNAMAARLLDVRESLARENRARVEALEQLVHAERLSTLGQFVSGVAHELGTPLGVIRGRAQLLRLGDATPDEVDSSARIIEDQVDRLTSLVRALLDYGRKEPPRMVAADVAAVAREAATLLSMTNVRREVTIVTPPPEVSVEAVIDPARIQQVVMNLVLNALQASPAGSTVRVTVGVGQTGRVRESLGVRAYVRVEDEGPGIDEATRARIFEPFFTTKRAGEGTGLGLSVVATILAAHDGWVEVDSAPGRGSRFTAWLPPPISTRGVVPSAPHDAG